MRLDLQHTQNEVLNNARWLQWEAFIYKSAPRNVNSPGLCGLRRFAAASASIKASSRASRGANKQILFCILRYLNTAHLADKDSCHSNVLRPCLLKKPSSQDLMSKLILRYNFISQIVWNVPVASISSGVWSVVPAVPFFLLPDGHLIIPIYKGTEAAWRSQRPHGCLYIWQMFSSDSL